jgi:hypothetical protein
VACSTRRYAMPAVSRDQATPRLESAIRSTLAPLLREDGFSGSGRTFRRVMDGWVHIIGVQGSRYGGAFAVNLAIHPLTIPDTAGKTPDPRKMKVEHCEFRRRLSETACDQWWKHATTLDSMIAAMEAAAQVYSRTGRPLLARVSGTDMPLMTVTAAEFVAGAYDFAGFSSTKVRMSLALARLRKSQGRLAESTAFAAWGLENVKPAEFLSREFKNV